MTRMCSRGLSVPQVLCACGALLAVWASPSLATSLEPAPLPAAPSKTSIAIPAPGQSVRVGGEAKVAAVKKGEGWIATDAAGEPMRVAITTPLPEGYAQPTPPGAIDLKTYPSIRRAQISGKSVPDMGMNMGFFPLFNHIQRRDIAMTSPVEMDYSGMRITIDQAAAIGAGKPAEAPASEPNAEPDAEAKPGDGADVAAPVSRVSLPTGWTMAFLYRVPELGETGKDGRDERVVIVDSKPMVVLAVGMQGGYSVARVREGIARIDAWLTDHPEFEPAGDARALYYNGPEKGNRDKWLEAQLPVRKREPAKPATDASASPPAGQPSAKP